MKNKRPIWILLLLTFLLSESAHAQVGLSNLVFTIGTSARNAASNNFSYLVIDSPSPAVLVGRKFAVYGKAGYPTNAGTFTSRGTISIANNTAAINTLLNQSVPLGQNLTSLSNALNGFLRKIPGITNQTLPQKLLTAFQVAATNPVTSQVLSLMGNGHPGLQLCSGRAFSEPLSTTTTYEIRELNPLNGSAGDVAGRVTIVPNAPVILPAPGQPFQVMTNDPSDHLLIRLRWGTPPALRRLSLLSYGFNLWRIPRTPAESGNFHIIPPTIAQLSSNTNFARANATNAIIALKEYSVGSGPGAADDPTDRTTYFFADDGRATTRTNFSNGQEFYYFVTARDLLGRDGLVSTGRLARACRRLAPDPPGNLRVENAVLPNSTNLPRLRVVWDQNTNATDAVSEYWVYRWVNPASALTNEATPLINRVGIVPQIAGTNRNYFLDTSGGALTNANPSNVWYTVRSRSVAACDPLISAAAGPAWGVLRDHTAPNATTGEVVGSCGIPAVKFQTFATNLQAVQTLQWNMTLTCTRRDPGIEWVTFTVIDWNQTNSFYPFATNLSTIGPLYFPPNGDTVRFEFVVAESDYLARTQQVSCVVGVVGGQVSPPASIMMPFASTNSPPREAVFAAGQLLTTALDRDDPLLLAYPGGLGACQTPVSVIPDASGMVGLQFSFGAGQLVLIQAQTNGVWGTVATVAPGPNQVYWVSYPACLIGPTPPFRGCQLNLPNSYGCDYHVTSGGVNGRTAPVQVRFPLTPSTREYRVYRQTDDGPLSMLAQGGANYDPLKTNKLIEVTDEVMPPSAARLCYFVQLLDENGNGSPLSFIDCKYVRPPQMPRPVLSEPAPAGTVGSPQVLLNWFCPTSGVSQFEIKIKRVNAPNPAAPSFLSSQLKQYVAYQPTSIFSGLKSSTLKTLQFDEAQITPLIGASFGPGPQFTLTASVLPNVEYEIAVAPMDLQGNVAEGSTSEAWRFVWTPPVVTMNVPWPARLLPPVRSFDDNLPPGIQQRVRATLSKGEGSVPNPRYPVGVSIGDFSRVRNYTVYWNDETTNFLSYELFQAKNMSPEDTVVYRRYSKDPMRNGGSLFPIVLYRQQITNAIFPRVSGDIIQVSPLIERLPWTIQEIHPLRFMVTIPDLAIGGVHYERLIFDDNDNTIVVAYSLICIRDLQPVMAGATYRYFVLRFNDKREPEEIIPAGDVDIPAN